MKEDTSPGATGATRGGRVDGKTVAIDRHLVGGIFWTATARWTSQLVSWGSLIVITRFVAPADFGLVAMAGVYLNIAMIVSQFGFGSAVITLRDLTESEVKQINAFAVLASLVMFGISCGMAKPLGVFFHTPGLPSVVAAMSITMLAAGAQTIPYSLLQRQFRFKLLSVMQTTTSMAQAISTLVLAYLGYGYWALVAGSVTGAVLSAAAVMLWEPTGFAWPRLKAIDHALKFSWEVLVAHASWSFYSDADFLIAGRVLGPKMLGQYGLAWNLATLPVEKVTTLVGQVTPAVFSARQTDYAELRRYLLLLTEGLSVITFPMGVGLAMTAPDVVPLVFGKVWVGAVVPLQILAFYGCVRSVSALIGPLLTALRNTRYVMLNNVTAALLMPIAFYIGSFWGIQGIAAGWIVAYFTSPLSRASRNDLATPPAAFVTSLSPNLLPSRSVISGTPRVSWTSLRSVATASSHERNLRGREEKRQLLRPPRPRRGSPPPKRPVGRSRRRVTSPGMALGDRDTGFRVPAG